MPRLKKSDLSPENIQNKLFWLRDSAHKYHLDTRSFAEHKALEGLYTGLGDFVDDIIEKLTGYLGGKRIGKLKVDEVQEYSHVGSVKLAEEVRDFGYELYEWATEKKYCDIENIAQGLSGLGAKTVYLLTLN